MSDETTIPLSSIYRKISTLRSAGLVYVRSYEITSEGKRQDLFLSSVTELRMGMGNEGVEVELIPTEESASRIWFDLFSR